MRKARKYRNPIMRARKKVVKIDIDGHVLQCKDGFTRDILKQFLVLGFEPSIIIGNNIYPLEYEDFPELDIKEMEKLLNANGIRVDPAPCDSSS